MARTIPDDRQRSAASRRTGSSVTSEKVLVLPAPLAAWIEATAGGEAVAIERRHAGGSREGWWVDVRRDGRVLPLFLRRDSGNGPLSGTRYSLEREARTLQAVHGRIPAVPEVLGIEDGEHCYLMQRMPGNGDFRSIAGSAQWDAVSRDYVQHLWRLHELDPATLPLPDHPIPQRPEDHALFEVDAWQAIYDRQVSVREPLSDFGFAWLRHHAPKEVQRTVLVHGDAGPANFLFEGERVTGLIDWELSHVGDPMEDIGGICVRGTWTPFGNLATYLGEYERRSGLRIQRHNVLYYMHVQFMRAVVGEFVALEGYDPATDVTLNTMSLVLGMRGMCQVMETVAGIESPPLSPAVPATSRLAPYYDVLAHNIATILTPELDDRYLQHRGRQLATLTRCLSRAQALGPAFDAEERDDIAQLMGSRNEDLVAAETELSTHIREHADGTERELIQYLRRRCERKAAIWAPALGPLYQNPLNIPEEL
jgi:aminoglycoside phosphotransferase (APT) family kinase protein